MAETKQNQVATQPQFNTQLSYYANQYIDLMERDLTERGMEFDSYSKECVSSAIGAIFQMVHESGLEFNEITGSNLKFIMQKVATLKLNANAQPRECYFQIRNVNIAPKGKDPDWEKQIEFNIEGDGNDSLVQRYGVNVDKVFPCWKIREGDKYIPPRHKGVEIVPPEWEESGKGKVVRVVYPIRYKDGHIEYHSCEREDVVKNLAAHIKNNLQNETFGFITGTKKKNGKDVPRTRYDATAEEKEKIDQKKAEIMAMVSEIGGLDGILNSTELRPYISPAWYELQSRESMIIRKMRNNIMKPIPKKWDSPVQAYEYNMLDATYREVREEIEANANQEEFSPMQIEEKEPAKTMEDLTAGKKEKEPISEKKSERKLPEFMKQESM